jgi:cell division protein FtsA
VLTKHQKDLGVVLVDIGFGTTSMSVYEENKLVGVNVFPVGAGNITNDLAVALKIPVAAAESLKVNYGYALSSDVNAKESIDLRKFTPEAKGMVSRRFIAEIIELRLAEMLEFVNNELRILKKVGQLAGGVVLVGGGAKMPGITELARQVLKLSSQVGIANTEEWSDELAVYSETFEDPEFSNALGLALWGADRESWAAKRGGSIFQAKNILRYFLP